MVEEPFVNRHANRGQEGEPGERVSTAGEGEPAWGAQFSLAAEMEAKEARAMTWDQVRGL